MPVDVSKTELVVLLFNKACLQYQAISFHPEQYQSVRIHKENAQYKTINPPDLQTPNYHQL